MIDAYASPTLAADASQYAAENDPGHPYASGQFNELLAKKFDQKSLCGPTGWYGEQTLDVEAVHATAPGAKILYVGASDCPTAFMQVCRRSSTAVWPMWSPTRGGTTGVTSWTMSATRTSVDNMLMMAATTGISVLFSSGDNGDEFTTLGFTSADYPASSPWVTAVGGTSLEVGAAGQRTGETGWSTGTEPTVHQAPHRPAGLHQGHDRHLAARSTWPWTEGQAEVPATSTPSPPGRRRWCPPHWPPATRR